MAKREGRRDGEGSEGRGGKVAKSILRSEGNLATSFSYEMFHHTIAGGRSGRTRSANSVRHRNMNEGDEG